MENKGNSHRECVLSSRVLLNVLDSLSLLVYCVRAERGSRRLSHIHPDRLSDKKRVRWLLLLRTRRARCAANKKSPTQTILAGIHCDAKRTKAAARAYSLFAFFGFTAELIFDRKLN
jgi:hypothetical protein